MQRQGRRSCQELIARLNMLPLDFWRSMLAFHLLGIIEFEKGERRPDISAEIAALLELNQKMQVSAVGGLGAAGAAALSASAAAVEKARAELLARFAPERFGSAAAPEIKKIARAGLPAPAGAGGQAGRQPPRPNVGEEEIMSRAPAEPEAKLNCREPPPRPN